ncbi:hypothetical protein CEUSTIGMA_g8299.t1 [Chlamydomonas eustigma]|uniref:EFHB C-terminal EF-hand domain-containing protein n=1 Tax=Chlamydomonas eustigma TaxID=1157962 RepID=A0A250XCS8_9CHLO|nr:hypothetical protein CEUSTIGMA_g8299.t1 [Chlamydomonas eustigma]|eukprot:GAX80864.1 hypothetical protein CEUSTIGMA_g8299.t1 [Chlamydomonas eustigma]
MFTANSLLRDKYISDSNSTWIRPAGVTTSLNETAKDAVTWDQPPSTPPEQKKYRQSTLHEPGRIVRHYGTAEDALQEGPFGEKTVSILGDNVATNMKNYPDSEITRWQLDRAEDKYASSQREPLGQTYVRGFKMPDGLGTEVAFGKKIGAKELERKGQVRSVVFPTEEPPSEDAAAHELYVRTHAAYDPGEQRRRHYDWQQTGVDPTTHKFGAVDKDNYQNGVKKALQPALDQTLPQPARVSNKIYEDYKASATDYLGKVKKLGAGNRPLPTTHVYGMPSLRYGREPGVDELIQGNFSPAEQGPDADLGKSLREGFRNIAPEGRTFGAPSIRTDIPMPKVKLVTNTINYGNEPDAFQLLRPPRSVERGVHEEHYMALRKKAEVQELMVEAGVELGSEDFEKVFDMASKADGEESQCCLDTFFRARHHLLAQTIQVPVPF